MFAVVDGSGFGYAATLRALAADLGCMRGLAVLDLETTGPAPAQDRIVELAVLLWSPPDTVRHVHALVHPGVPIPLEASAVHGITDDEVRDAPPFGALAAALAEVLRGVDVVGYNARRFDVPMLRAEFARCGIEDPLADCRILDPFVLFRKREPRDLAAAVRAYCGAEHEGHRAEDDAAATLHVLAAQLERYADLPADLDHLHVYCEDRDPAWIDAEGKLAWRGSEAVWTVGKNAGRTLRELARADAGFLDWVLARDFPADTKAIVRAALAGRLPQRGDGAA